MRSAGLTYSCNKYDQKAQRTKEIQDAQILCQSETETQGYKATCA